MKIKPDWTTYLRACRRRVVDTVFDRCPDDLFATGLELGARDGFQSRLISRYVSHLVSTDYHRGILDNHDTDRIEYRVCDAEEVDLVFAPAQFDLVFSSHMLQHVPDPARVLRGIARVMKVGGVTIHVVPSRFWKLCDILLHVPNLAVLLLENLIRRGGASCPAGCQDGARDRLEQWKQRQLANNPKTVRRRRPLALRVLLPDPLGVSRSNLEELRAFGRSRWAREFRAADLEIVAIIKGTVNSGKGFGLDFLRRPLEKLGLTSEYIYVAVKRGQDSPYLPYLVGSATPPAAGRTATRHAGSSDHQPRPAEPGPCHSDVGGQQVGTSAGS